MTSVTYGEDKDAIEIGYAKTEARESYPIYDDSGTDQLYTRYVYSVEGVYVSDALGQTPAEISARLNHMLLLPRKKLVVRVGGRIMLEANPPRDPAPVGVLGPNAGGKIDPKMDAQNGPKPRELTVTKITDESFLIRWSVEVCLRDCPEGGKGRKYTSNRWEVTHQIAANNMSVMTTRGRLTTTTDLLNGGTIDDLRGLCTPPVLSNFTREAEYHFQKDGLAIDYTFTDTENYIQPPPDAVKMSGTFTRSTNTFGAQYWAEVQLRLEGRRDVPKKRLMATAIAVAMDKLFGGKPNPAGLAVVKDGMFREHLEANVVEVHLRGMVQPENVQGSPGTTKSLLTLVSVLGVAALDIANGNKPKPKADEPKDPRTIQATLDAIGHPLLGCSLPDQQGKGIAPELRGNLKAIRVWAAAFQDPCLNASVGADVIEGVEQQTASRPLPAPTQKPVAISPGSTLTHSVTKPVVSAASLSIVSRLPVWSERKNVTYLDQYPGVYEEYDVVLTYKKDTFKCMLPATVSGQVAKSCQMANPHIELTAEWTAKKIGNKPTVPDWKEPDGANAVLLKSGVAPGMVEIAPDGSNRVYSITGWYLFGFKDSTKVEINSPIPPWMNLDSRQLRSFPADSAVIFGDTGPKKEAN